MTEPPSTIGKRGKLVDINGQIQRFIVRDEIRFRCSNDSNKMVYLQRLCFDFPGKPDEYRLGYYVIGKKEGHTRSKWLWGQFATMLPKEDWIYLIKQISEKDWFTK
jgi:hypothetical protein